MVGSVAGDLPEQVKNNQSVNLAAGNGGQKMSQYSWFTVYVSTAYRNCTPGKCNIDFAKEVFEYIVKCKSAYIFVGDFSNFFDRFNHRYLKENIKCVIGEKSLDAADYAIYKNVTKFTYVEADDIESVKSLYLSLIHISEPTRP